MLDETSNIWMVSLLVMRYIHDRIIQEKFIGFTDISQTKF
jgi:hypothetical protein